MPDFTKGTSLSWNGATVALLTNIGNPELSIESKDKTTHQSPGRFREFGAGLVDSGNIQISGYFAATDTTGQQAMFTDAAAGTVREVVITGPDSLYSFTFNAFITAIKRVGDAPIDDNYAFTASLKITGEPAFATTASTGMSAAAFSDSGVVAPTFAIGTYEYVVNFLTGVDSFTITPTAATHTITVTANGASQTVTSGAASSAISLGSAGSMTEVTVTVQESGKVAKTYTFYCVRAAS